MTRYILKYTDSNWNERVIPVKIDDIDSIRNKIDSFLKQNEKGYVITIIEIFNRKFTNWELQDYELLTFDQWYEQENNEK